MDEEIKTKKKQWQKPELIVLVRSKPEEAVLGACKFVGTAGPSDPQCGALTACQILGAS